MGKAKNQSDDQHAMDIEEVKPKQLSKKKRLIVKKERAQKSKATVSSTPEKKRNLIHQLAKKVNLKNKHKSLQHKQQIFQRVVKGLHDKSQISKKDKKKTRVLLKKELRKHLQQERIHARKKSTDMQSTSKTDQIVQIKNPQKFKKKQINERAQAAQFKNLMGAGLSNIRDLISKKTTGNIHHQ